MKKRIPITRPLCSLLFGVEHRLACAQQVGTVLYGSDSSANLLRNAGRELIQSGRTLVYAAAARAPTPAASLRASG